MSVAVVFLGGRRLVVGYGLQSLPNVLGIVGGKILLKLVTVFGLAGLDGIFRFISRFLVFIFVIGFAYIMFRLKLVLNICIEPRFVVGVACYCFSWYTEASQKVM